MRLGENSIVDFTGLPYEYQVEEYYLRAYKLKEDPNHVLIYPIAVVSDGVKIDAFMEYYHSMSSGVPSTEWFLAG